MVMQVNGIQNDTVKAISFMLVGMLFFSMLDAGMKWLADHYNIIQVAFFRSAFSLLPLAILLWAKGGVSLLKTKIPLWHLARGVIDYLALLCIILAFSLMPIANATAIAFTAPLFITALSIPFLGEKVGPYRWGAIIVGFIGTLIIIQPGMTMFNWGAIAALASALLFSVNIIMTKKMTKTERSITIVFISASIWTVFSLILLPFFWETPTSYWHFALFVLLGLVGGAGQYCLSEAIRLGSPSVVTPYEYSGLIWANLFGLFIWNEIPNNPVILGTLIIVCAGLYILYRESAVYNREKTIVDNIHQSL